MSKMIEAQEIRKEADRLLRSDKEKLSESSLSVSVRTLTTLVFEVEELQKEAQEKTETQKKIKELQKLKKALIEESKGTS